MTPTRTHDTEILVDPDVTVVRVIREFDATPDEDLGDGRTRLVATSLVDSFADRDAMVASGTGDGIRESYERLDEVLS